MKSKSISINEMKNNFIYNVKNKLKIIICIIILFLLCGIILGVVESNKYKNENVKSTYESPLISFSDLDSDSATYYFDCMTEAVSRYNELTINLYTLSQMELNSENMKNVNSLLDDNKQDNRIRSVITNFENNPPVEFEKKEQFISEVEAQIKESNGQLESYQTIIDKNANKKNPSAVDAFSKANGEYKTESKKNKELIALKEKAEALDEQNCNGNIILYLAGIEDSVDSINSRITEYNKILESISEQEGYIITSRDVQYSESSLVDTEIVENQDSETLASATFYARSVYVTDKKREIFLGYTLFFAMIGAGISILYALFKGTCDYDRK